MRLLPKQARFVCEYVKSGNGEQSAINAGYAAGSARSYAAQLLAKLNIRNAVRDKQNAIAMRALLSVEDVLRETMVVAFSSLEDFLDFSGDEIADKRACEIDEDKIRALQSVKITTKTTTLGRGEDALVEVTKTVEYRLWNKLDALDKLAKHFGMFLDQDEIERLRAKADDLRARLSGQPKTAAPTLPDGDA